MRIDHVKFCIYVKNKNITHPQMGYKLNAEFEAARTTSLFM